MSGTREESGRDGVDGLRCPMCAVVRAKRLSAAMNPESQGWSAGRVVDEHREDIIRRPINYISASIQRRAMEQAAFIS